MPDAITPIRIDEKTHLYGGQEGFAEWLKQNMQQLAGMLEVRRQTEIPPTAQTSYDSNLWLTEEAYQGALFELVTCEQVAPIQGPERLRKSLSTTLQAVLNGTGLTLPTLRFESEPYGRLQILQTETMRLYPSFICPEANSRCYRLCVTIGPAKPQLHLVEDEADAPRIATVECIPRRP